MDERVEKLLNPTDIDTFCLYLAKPRFHAQSNK